MSVLRPLSRVTLVSPYALSVFGGVQEQVLAMSRELSRRGLVVQVVAPDARDHVAYESPATFARFGTMVRLPANGSRAPLTLSGRAARAAARAVADFGPDVVHFHEPFAPRVGYVIRRHHHYPAVATFHRSGEGPAVRLAAPLLRRWARDLDRVAAVSTQAATTARASCGRDCDVLFNGFEMERFVEFPREVATTTTLVVVGRLEARKGVATAVAAVLHHNATETVPWRLVVVGDGPARPTLEHAAQGDRLIEFVGAVSDEEKRRWLRRADVVVAPATHGESFGLVLLEAMASETRVVASDIAGYRDAAGVHAVWFTPHDALDLERAVVEALRRRDPEILRRARDHAQHWSMSRLVDEYLTMYDDARRHFLALG